MADLIEKYVHQVGRYVPEKERAEIEAELRSMIQDKLDDRYDGAPTQNDVVAVLTELGDPRLMAVSYSRDQYLVGPELYPFMMMGLRRGWLIIPMIVVVVRIIEALLSTESTNVIGLLLGTVLSALQALLIFSAVVVLFFAILQHSGEEFNPPQTAFNPLDLPEVDDAYLVNRFETAFGIAFGTLIGCILLYFMSVGGLTLRLNIDNPGNVIPVPMVWLTLLTVSTFAMVILHLVILRRNRWTLPLAITELLLELFGGLALYFVLFKPLVERILTTTPSLNDVALVVNMPEILAVCIIAFSLATNLWKRLKLWNYKPRNLPPYTMQML